KPSPTGHAYVYRKAACGADGEVVGNGGVRRAKRRVSMAMVPLRGRPVRVADILSDSPRGRRGDPARWISGGRAVRGIVYTGDKAELTEERGLRGPGGAEVVVRTVAAGVCHSDLSVVDGTIPWPSPSVLGHEGAGVVEEVGSAVTMVKPGDHVVVSTLASCGMCRWCNTGRPAWCRRSMGNVSQPFTFRGEPAYNFAATSSFAERTVVEQVQAVPISKDVPLKSACLIACGVLTGVGAVLNRATVVPGQTAAVFGVGGVGVNVIQVLRL